NKVQSSSSSALLLHSTDFHGPDLRRHPLRRRKTFCGSIAVGASPDLPNHYSDFNSKGERWSWT
ncbi:hypothetical protein A2U01_0029719, partial [Trifolium medium]|nr:hypothetical protein [Trifolium medium]